MSKLKYLIFWGYLVPERDFRADREMYVWLTIYREFANLLISDIKRKK